MAFVREVCTTFGFRDPLGHLQDAGCLVALRDLAHVGVLALPPAGPGAGVDRAVRDLAAAVPPPVGIPDRVDPVEGPVVTLAETDTVCRRLGTMLDAEHPLGVGLHVGRPLRYPVGSDHGWLGGCMVAVPALVLKPRNRWIGRDAAGREAHLDRVVGLARFLIRPGLACRPLASTVLGLCLGRLTDDYAARYGVAPLPVETFVDPAHGGISLRATNRIHVGMSAGRGRRADSGAQVPAKGIRMYPLVRDWRRHLGLAGPAVLLPPPPAWRLAPGAGLDSDHWAQTEFGGVPVGNAALARRLVASARIQATAPMKTFPQSAGI